VPDPARPLRVLQLIGDTDVTTEHLAALALHRELQRRSFEVRTLALAPGRVGGLDQDVPAVAPSRRSLAARAQVAGESRWADVVVLHGPGALGVATAPLRSSAPVPTVVGLWGTDAHDLPRGAAVRRTLRAASAVVAVADTVADAVGAGLADVIGAGHELVVLPADLDDPERPRPAAEGWARLLTRVAG
jgi:hypothetical protein